MSDRGRRCTIWLTLKNEPRFEVDGQSLWPLYIIRRSMVDTLGMFPVFNINGSEHVVDGTTPHDVDRIPRDAYKLTTEQATTAWRSDGHYMGGGLSEEVREQLMAQIRQMDKKALRRR